jgi:hypothetical protein
MNACLSYVADPLNTDVGEVAYCARHYGCPVLAQLSAQAVKAVLVPVGVDAMANGKIFVTAIERRSSWL